MADKPIEQDENLEISRKVNNESGMQKLFRAGVLALGFSVVGKKMGIKNNDLLKYTGVAAASMLMSDDDDRAGDLIAVGTVFGLSSGSKMLRSMAMENIDTYTKIYNRLESFDKTINNFNIGMMSLKDSVAKATKKTFDNNYDKIKSKQSEKELSSKINIASNFVKASINTITDGTKYLFTHSISETMDALTDSDLKRKYYMYYKDVDFKKIETSVNDFLKEVGVDIKHTDVGKIEQYGDEILSKISKAGFDTNMSAAESIKEFQKMKKIQLIENNTFFTDMLGMYSRLDKDSGKVVARYGQILKDNANTLDGMVRLADNFVSSLDKNTSAKYAEASAEVKEEMFLKYLRKKGFGEVIDKFYNKEDHIKIGDVNSLFENVTMEEVQNSEIKDFLSSATRNQMKNFVTYTRPTDYADEVETIEGIKHADILSNFSFTNVVTKSKFGVQDKTALDGTTTFLQTLGAIDRNVVSTFRSIFSTQERMWNTFSFINSRNRIKDVVANDILGFGYNKYGFIIDGKRITEEAEVINDNGIDIINMKYATNGKRNHRISYKRSILDVVNEDYKVAKENVRNESSIKDIIHTFKTKGVKQALSEFSYSAYNPLFGIRYDVGVGIRGASTNRGYYKDSKNILSIFNKKNPDDLKALNRKDGKIKNILTTLFGDYSDINIDRMRAESDKYEEVVNSFKKILVNRYINDGIENKDRTVFDDAFEFIDNKYKETILKNSKIKDKRAITLINDMFYYATELPDYNDIRQYLKGYTKEESLEVARVITDLVDANNALIYMKAKKINPENMEKLFSSKAFQSYMQSDNLGLYDQKYFDKILKTIKTSDEKKSYEELYNFVRGYQNVKREINRDIDTFFSNSTNVFKQSFKDASNNLDIKTNKNPFNPVYELIRGKRLNDHFNTFVQSKINDESSLIVNTLKTLEGTLDPSYSLTNLKKTIEELPKMFLDKKMQQGLNKVKKTIDKSLGVQEESVLKLKSFEYFNKIKSDIKENYGKADAETIQELHSKFGKTLNIGNMSFKDMIKIRDTLLYKNQGESVSSVIVEDSLKKGASVREILKNVKISIMRMISGNKFDIDRKKYASYTDELKNFKSKNFNRTDSTLSLGGKSIINNLQNSLEYIGVERLTNKELGDHFSQQVWNYTKKE